MATSSQWHDHFFLDFVTICSITETILCEFRRGYYNWIISPSVCGYDLPEIFYTFYYTMIGDTYWGSKEFLTYSLEILVFLLSWLIKSICLQSLKYEHLSPNKTYINNYSIYKYNFNYKSNLRCILLRNVSNPCIYFYHKQVFNFKQLKVVSVSL